MLLYFGEGEEDKGKMSVLMSRWGEDNCSK